MVVAVSLAASPALAGAVTRSGGGPVRGIDISAFQNKPKHKKPKSPIAAQEAQVKTETQSETEGQAITGLQVISSTRIPT